MKSDSRHFIGVDPEIAKRYASKSVALGHVPETRKRLDGARVMAPAQTEEFAAVLAVVIAESGKASSPAEWAAWFTRHELHLSGVFTPRAEKPEELVWPRMPGTGALIDNPAGKPDDSDAVNALELIESRSPRLARLMRDMVKRGNSFTLVAELESERADAEEIARMRAGYDEVAHGKNPYVTGDVEQQSVLEKSNPRIAAWLRDAGTPRPLNAYGPTSPNLTFQSRLEREAPLVAKVLAEASRLHEAWVADELDAAAKARDAADKAAHEARAKLHRERMAGAR
jgi:hypothetical protein